MPKRIQNLLIAGAVPTLLELLLVLAFDSIGNCEHRARSDHWIFV